MNKKFVIEVIVFLVLSVVVTYGVSIVDALMRNSFLAGEAGFPFRFSSSSFLGSENTDFLNLILDIIFWFVILFGIWKLFQKITSKV